MTIRVFESNPTYDEWCEANGLDPDDDEILTDHLPTEEA